MLRKSNIQWSATALVNQMKKENVNFECSVQRGYVWDDSRKSLLIHSMIEGYPIPAFFFSKREDGRYDALDGKQRSNSIFQFVADEFSLSENTPFVILDSGEEYEIQSCKFSNLPEELQQRIKDYSLTIYYFDGITDEEIGELFYRLNNGKPLSSVELTRVRAKSLEAFQQIANHKTMKFAVSEKGRIKYFDEQLAMQMYTICFDESPSFITREFRPLIENIIVTTSQVDLIAECLDMIYDLYQQYDPETKEDKKMLRKIKARTHIVSLVYLAKLCIDSNKKDLFNSIANRFFNSTSGTSIDPSYNKAAGTGSAKTESVRARMESMKNLLNN